MSDKVNAAAELPPVPPFRTKGDERDSRWRPERAQTDFNANGDMLPVGIIEGGQLHKGFDFRDYGLPEERTIANLRKQNVPTARYVAKVLSLMLTSVGQHNNFASLDDDQKLVIINRMYLADIMYMYFQLRRRALGDVLAINMKCDRCGHKWRFEGDLAATEVSAVERADHICWWHKLRDGLDNGKGQRGHWLLLQPPLWRGLQGQFTNPADVTLNIINTSFMRLEGVEHAVTPAMLGTLSKYDLEMIKRDVDACSPGPDMTLEPSCPECGHDPKIPINWDWDFFFTGASL